ncbi:MAG: membrane integrity-associated transporter subunit PqiC [Gammaproteobacteria bacterium]
MKANRRVIRRGLLAGLCLLAACTTGAPSPRPRHYLLAAPGAAAVIAAAPGWQVAVGPVTVAPYLDQARIVTRADGPEVTLHDTARWAMPLAAGVAAGIRVVFEQALPGSVTSAYPAVTPVGYARRVAIEVTRLDGEPGGQVVLEAAWRVFAVDGRELDAGTAALTQPVAAGMTALVAAEGALVSELGGRIAARLAATR